MLRWWFFLALGSLSALAHDPGLSSATVDLSSHDVLVQVVFAPADLAGLPTANLAAQSVEMRSGTATLPATSVETRQLGADNVEYTLRFARPAGVAMTFRSALLGRLPFGHRQALTVRDEAGTTTATEMLSADHDGIPLPTAPARPTAASASHPFPTLRALGALGLLLAGWLVSQLRSFKAAV